MLFAIKLYSCKDIFKHIRKKHGIDIYDVARLFENLKTNYNKTSLDITLTKSGKQGHFLPTFAKA